MSQSIQVARLPINLHFCIAYKSTYTRTYIQFKMTGGHDVAFFLIYLTQFNILSTMLL